MSPYKRWTNYNHRMAGGYDPAAELATALSRRATQQARCTDGEHDVRVAKPGYVTYVRGRQVEPGTRYCCFCSVILADAAGDTPGERKDADWPSGRP